MQSISTPILFSRNQVDEFGRLTGDDGPVHSEEGVVQGGLIIGSLPKYFKNLMIEKKLMGGYVYSVSMIVEAKFRNRLLANTPATLEFSYKKSNSSLLKLHWRIYDSNLDYCDGIWVIYKSKS